ncbi:CMD domain-containing protein [Erwinia psidii]|uniref:Oxidoreductase n=1 Tax=Erwinia psidii TaxID=69224 RepID=A0A3N6RZM8_9GAMM|nr:oxidoreductase [Erwinia psidii]MCX8955981.1 oxidoreductase [Erwinia psidii]RQM38688.1 oxidoreductase [Erwinia psidii]
MEQRRFSGNSHLYHETQCTLTAPTAPLVPEAAEIGDRFLLGLDALCGAEVKSHLDRIEPALLASRDLYQLLFPRHVDTSMTHTLTLYDRLSAALTVAQVTGIQRLCNHYAARLNPLAGPDPSRESNLRLTQMTEYARQLASQPALITPVALRRLDEVGLTVPDIITYNQITGFISYQARVVAGINALLALPVRWFPGLAEPEDATAECFNPVTQWQPLLPPVELRYASASQLEVLTWCQPQPEFSDCAWLLAHDAATLHGWGTLINILRENASTQEGALAAAVAARINGSAACLWRYRNERLRDALRQSVSQALAIASPSEQAVIQAAAQLTRTPERFSATHLQPLNNAGLTDRVAFDVILQVALANWSNRLIQTLGTASGNDEQPH